VIDTREGVPVVVVAASRVIFSALRELPFVESVMASVDTSRL
jgi:hypothetical protein